MRARAIAAEVVREVIAAPSDDPWSEALLLVYAQHGALIDGAAEVAGERLDGALAALGERPLGAALWGGLAGAGWHVAHLAGGDEAEEVLGTIDEALLAGLAEDGGWSGDYDLIGGLVGIGLYAVEAATASEAAAARRIAARVLDHLEAWATEDGPGLAWYTPARLLPEWQREICPDGYQNLGLAHGIPGVVALAAELIAADVEAARARRLLDGAAAWLRWVAPPREPARFPSWRGRGAGDAPARLAWCYGDPGVVVSLCAAAQVTGDAALLDEVRAMTRAMAARPVEDCGVRDAGFCHGAAGVAHIFNRLWQATGEPAARDAARAWLDRAIAMRRPGEAIAGFPSLRLHDGKESWEADGSLMGAPGVALVLLAASGEVEPGWDRLFGVNVTPMAPAEPTAGGRA